MSIVGLPAVAKAGVWGVDHGYVGKERDIGKLSFAVDLKLFFLMKSGGGVVHKMNVITSFGGWRN